MEGRYNVLGKLIIPRITLSLDYIKSELEETAREDNFRLKRFKQLKIKRQLEKVKICSCCYSSSADKEYMDGDMCIICKNNVQNKIKVKVEQKVPFVHCVKDGRLQHERACHLDSEWIHSPNEYDKNDESKQFKNKEIPLLADVLPVTYEEYEVQIKDEETLRISDTLHEKENDRSKGIIEYPEHDLSVFLCSETQRTHMYSYILKVLNSAYDGKEDIDLPEVSPLHLKQLLKMPANLPYPYEGVEYFPRILHMPRDLIPSYNVNCRKYALQYQAHAEKIRMPLDLTSSFIPCVECKSLLGAKIHKSSCELNICKKYKSLLHMPLDLPIDFCQNCSSKAHFIMPLDILNDVSSYNFVHKSCENELPITSFLTKPATHSSYLPYELPRETLICHSWTPNLKKQVNIPRNLTSNSAQSESANELANTSGFSCQHTHVSNPKYHALHMYIKRLCQPECNEDSIRMPLNLMYENQPNPHIDVVDITEHTLHNQLCTEKIIMPSDLVPSSIPCVECKSNLDEKVHKSSCELKDCEKFKPLLHMPLDLSILSCRNCSSKSHIIMPLDIKTHLPCPSVNKNCEKMKLTTSFSQKIAPHSSCFSYELPRETLVCHSWTPKLKKLLRMPRNLTSISTQSEPTNEPSTSSRCSCQQTDSSNPKNKALNIYIRRLCQPKCNEDYLRMPLNLKPCPHDVLIIAEDVSNPSISKITTSEEKKLFHNFTIDKDHCCDSNCSLNIKDFDKIVKVKTMEKRRTDGAYQKEKVISEKYHVKSTVKPQKVCSKSPDICSKPLNICSQSSYICSEPSNICSKPSQACCKSPDIYSKSLLDICSCSRSDEIEDILLGIWSFSHIKQDEDKADTQLDTESECTDCISKKYHGNKDNQKQVSIDNFRPQIICRCNEDENKQFQIKCECYKVAMSENNNSENICSLGRLSDLLSCKNDGCLTQKLVKSLSPCRLENKQVASDYNASHPCHSIVIKSADNEIVVCRKSHSKELSSKMGSNKSSPQKDVDIVSPCCRFFKSKEKMSGITPAGPISPIDTEMMTSLSMKWYDESSSSKNSAQLDQESKISKILKSFLYKNNHKGTSCTDLKIVEESIKKSEELMKSYKSVDLCDKSKHCHMKDCPFHSMSKDKAASLGAPTSKSPSNNKSHSESFLPVAPQNTENSLPEQKLNNMLQSNLSQKVEFKDEHLKIKEKTDVTKLISTNDNKTYSKTTGQEESHKSCCPIPSKFGLPITQKPVTKTPKSTLASNTNDAQIIEEGTQTKISKLQKNKCSTESAQISHSVHKSKNEPSHHSLHDHHSNNHHDHYTQEKSCTVCSEKSFSSSSLSSKHNHQDHHYDHYHDHHRDHTKEKCLIKIKIKDAKKPFTENDEFYIEGEMEDGSNVVILRQSKSNISKETKNDEFQEGICKNCLAILRGEKSAHSPSCIHKQQAKKCKYCDLLANYSVGDDPSANVSAVDSSNRCCQTSTLSAKSSYLSSVSAPEEDLYTKFSTSPSQSNKTRFTPCSDAASSMQLKSCEHASEIRGYTSDCTIHKPITSCGTTKPCKSVCIVYPRTSDACTSTKVANRYDVRSVCDEPRTRRRGRCTPKPSNSRCVTRSVQCPMKSDTTLNRRKRKSRPPRSRSFYESDCKYFKPPCCGCPF